MNHKIVSAKDWLAARRDFLKAEKELTRHRDEVAQKRLALPWVRIEKEYVFDTLDGPRTLADLFDGRSQLLVQHFMFAPGWKEGCPLALSWPIIPMASTIIFRITTLP